MRKKKKTYRGGGNVSFEEGSRAAQAWVSERKDLKLKPDKKAASEAAAMLARRRLVVIGKKRHLAQSRKGGLNYWKKLTPEERTIEIKRRAMLRSRNYQKKKRLRLLGKE